MKYFILGAFLFLSTSYVHAQDTEMKADQRILDEENRDPALVELEHRAELAQRAEHRLSKETKIQRGQMQIVEGMMSNLRTELANAYPGEDIDIGLPHFVDRTLVTLSVEYSAREAERKTININVYFGEDDLLVYVRRESAKLYFPVKFVPAVLTVLEYQKSKVDSAIHSPIEGDFNISTIEFKDIRRSHPYPGVINREKQEVKLVVPVRAQAGSIGARLYQYEYDHFSRNVTGLHADQIQHGDDAEIVSAFDDFAILDVAPEERIKQGEMVAP